MKSGFANTVVLVASLVTTATSSPLNSTLVERGGPGKRGLAWPWYNSPLNPARLNDGSGSVRYIYDWETYQPPSSNGAGGLSFIGMQRCLDCDSSPVSQLSTRQAQQGWQMAFSLNEADQAGISPSQAAAWYKQWVNPLRIQKSIPSVSSSTSSGQGLDWVAQFISACAGGCFFDWINLHWYGNSFTDFQNYINAAHARFPNNQLIITEFALQNPGGGQADQVNFFRQAFSFLDNAPFVSMYFPFVATSPALMQQNDGGSASFVGTGSTLFNNDGSISAVGQLMLS